MRIINFTIPGRAVALQRPRINFGAVRRFRGAGRGGGPLVYTPYKCKKWQKFVKSVAPEMTVKLRLPIGISVDFYLKKPGTRTKFAHRPDIDNYVKNLLDALDNHVIEDDAFVTNLTATKQFVELKSNERTEVSVWGE